VESGVNVPIPTWAKDDSDIAMICVMTKIDFFMAFVLCNREEDRGRE